MITSIKSTEQITLCGFQRWVIKSHEAFYGSLGINDCSWEVHIKKPGAILWSPRNIECYRKIHSLSWVKSPTLPSLARYKQRNFQMILAPAIWVLSSHSILCSLNMRYWRTETNHSSLFFLSSWLSQGLWVQQKFVVLKHWLDFNELWRVTCHCYDLTDLKVELCINCAGIWSQKVGEKLSLQSKLGKEQ